MINDETRSLLREVLSEVENEEVILFGSRARNEYSLLGMLILTSGGGKG